MSRRSCVVGCLVLSLLALGYAASRGVGRADTKGDAPKPPTHKVEKGPFKLEASLKGVFEAGEMAPVAVSLEAWTPQGGGAPLRVRKAVEHGARVSEGDTLVWLDLDRIDQAISDLEAERDLAKLAIRLGEKELPVLEEAVPADLAAAERAKKVADEDLAKFLKEDREFAEKSAEQQVKSARNYLEYAQEELKQLEKMYKADDLTEETEEIILRRQRNYVEQAAFSLKMAEKRRDDTLNVDLPRRDQTLRENALKQTLELDKAKATLPLTLDQKKLTVAKLKYDRAKASDRLAKLKKDREAMTVKAPAGGIVYYGRCDRGQWPTAGAMADKLRPGGQLQPEEVVMTIVRPAGLFIRAEVEEKDLHHLKLGMEVKVVPTGRPDRKLKGKVESVSAIPVTPGKFEARVAVDLPEEGRALMPGMACSVKAVPYLKEEALTVPASAVFADELDDEKHYVYVPAKAGGEPEKREVKVGKRTDQKVEILEGLNEGDEVLQKKPGQTPSPTPAGPEKKEGE